MRKTKRADCVKRVVRAIASEYGTTNSLSDPDLQDCVKDILADLRHLCDRKKWDFWDLDRIAHRTYYLPETKGMSAEYEGVVGP